MVHTSSTMWRITNQPPNPTSCSDNALRLLVLLTSILYWGLHVMSWFSIWGCVLKGCLERVIFWRAKSCLKGIEDYNLEHWCTPAGLRLLDLFSFFFQLDIVPEMHQTWNFLQKLSKYMDPSTGGKVLNNVMLSISDCLVFKLFCNWLQGNGTIFI